VRPSSSGSFGQMMSHRAQISSGSFVPGGAGAVFKIVKSPFSWPRRRAATVVSIGISSWQTMTPHELIAAAAFPTSSGVKPSAAPGTMTMEF